MALSSNCFTEARKVLDELLGGLTFMKVISIQKSGKSYTGEVVEIGSRNENLRTAFFDKFGRSRNNLQVGPITLTQAPLGFEDDSSVPSTQEILVGTLVKNEREKSHLKWILRGWSSDAKPLRQLFIYTRFGTRKSEFETRDSLLQPAALLSGTLKQFRDEIYLLARVILWGNLRPLQVLASIRHSHIELQKPASPTEIEAANKICISMDPMKFVQLITVKLQCSSIYETFEEGLIMRPKSPEELPPVLYSPSNTSHANTFQSSNVAQNTLQSIPRTQNTMNAQNILQNIPQNIPNHMISNNPVVYNPSSPVYNPSSPVYNPSSPVYNPSSPVYNPSSPVYNPSSPVYNPSSPVYNPSSPPSSTVTTKICTKSPIKSTIMLQDFSDV